MPGVDWGRLVALPPERREAALANITGIWCGADPHPQEYPSGGATELDLQATSLGLQYQENGPGWVPQRSIRSAIEEVLETLVLPTVSMALVLMVFMHDPHAVTHGGRHVVQHIASRLYGGRVSGHERAYVAAELQKAYQYVARALLPLLDQQDRAAVLAFMPVLADGRVVRSHPVIVDGGARWEYGGLAVVDRAEQRRLRKEDRARGDERRWPGTLKADVHEPGEVTISMAPKSVHHRPGCEVTCATPCREGMRRLRVVPARQEEPEISALMALRGLVAGG